MGKGDPVRGHQAGVIRGTFRRSITSPFRKPPYRAALSQLHREDCTLVAWYRSLYAPRTGGAYDSHYRTARIAGCTRRRGSGVAARGAGAAVGDAGGRVPQPCLACRMDTFLDRIPHGLRDSGFIEGQDVAIEFRWAEGRYDKAPVEIFPRGLPDGSTCFLYGLGSIP